jgi:osmoprotectant transport system ATP-binding protein
MVTHDIDEAIKLGDVVAIFRQGGLLAQVGTPQELLEHPVDEFVAEFVGRDRGLRSLSFDTAADLPVRPVTETDLVLDEAGRPTGWRTAAGIEATGGTFTRDDSLRLVTDLAISSPVGIAVRVGPDGAADGLVLHHDLVDYLAGRRTQRAAS